MIGDPLTSDRLQLTRVRSKDLESIHALHCYPEVAKFNTIGIPEQLEETFAVCKTALDQLSLEDPSTYLWAIRIQKTGHFVGEIGLKLSSKKYAKGEIHFGLMPPSWGMGYASEAAARVVEYCFNELELHRVEAGVAVHNVKSFGLLERIGMQREGHHKKILPLAMGWTDNYSYALLKEDWDARYSYKKRN